MSFLNKLFGEKAPKWAQPISLELFTEFQQDVQQQMNLLGILADFDWELGVAIDRQNPRTYGFHQLVYLWRDAEPIHRKAVVAKFFDDLEQISVLLEEPLDQHLERLKYSVYGHWDLPKAKDLACFPIGEHLNGVLVLEVEQSLATVNTAMVEKSGLTLEELVEIAKTNIWRHVSTEISRETLGDGHLTFVEAEAFGASQILLLEHYTTKDETYWVAVPTYDKMVIMEPNQFNDETLFGFLLLVTEIGFETIERRLPQVLFEYKNGVLRDLCDHRGDQIVIKPNWNRLTEGPSY